MLNLTLRRVAFGLSFVSWVTLVGCGHGKIEEVTLSSDPNAEISNLERDHSAAAERHRAVVSPVNFEKSEKALKEAKERREKGKDADSILKKVSESRHYLRKSDEVAEKADRVLGGVLERRNEAVTEGAPHYVKADFEKADHELIKVSKDVEKNDIRDAEKRYSELQNRYMALELAAIKTKKMGPAKELFEQASHEGAKKVAPQTFHQTDRILSETDSYITANRHSYEEVNNRSKLAYDNVARLLRITRATKVANQLDAENLVLAAEARDNEVNKLSNAVNATAGAQALKRHFDYAYRQFDPSEAEVYQQKDKLLIRLKGLSFPTGTGEIRPTGFNTLNKVKKIISGMDQYKVTVEGHTDSTGSVGINKTLSAKRADAVKQFLVSDQEIPSARVMTVGFGDSRPLASNKNVRGRAQNRRVDIVLEPASLSSSQI